MIKFTIQGKPIPKGRPRVTRYGTYTPQRTLDYEKLVQWSFREVYKGLPLEKPVSMQVACYFKLPKKTDRKVGDWCTNTSDLDNLMKSICDGLNGVAYLDDKQVVELFGQKKYGAEECVVVKIIELE